MTLQELDALMGQPIAFAYAAKAMLAEKGISIATLADRLDRSKIWLSARLDLVNLHASIQPLVESGELKLVNAYTLAKCPVEQQLFLLNKALTSEPQNFLSSWH